MASLKDCLGAAVTTGKITEDEAELVSIVADYEANRISEKGVISYADAYEQAANKAIDDFFEGKEIAKRQKVLQIKRVNEALTKAKTHPDGMYTGVMSLLVNDLTGKANYNNVDKLGEVIKGQAHARMAEMLEAYRPKRAGFSTNTDGARNIILEVFGHNTKDEDAKFFAESWKAVSEEMRQRFNLAGGAIRKRKDWGMPQSHDPAVMKSVGYDKWYKDISELLDWEAMRAQYLNKIEGDIYGEASVKQAAREQKAKLVDEYQELGARELALKAQKKNITQYAATSPDIAKQIFDELKGIRARRKTLKTEIEQLKITQVQKAEDLPEALQQRLQNQFEDIKTRYDENTQAILEGELEPELRKTYDAIVTDGISELEPSGAQKQSGKLANRHSAARELLFKDGEAFLKYHDMYGRGSVYGNMLSHLDNMASEIALLETLGTNPEFTFNYLRDSIIKDNPELKGSTKINFLESTYKTVSGDIHRSVSSNLANLMSGTRAMFVAARLGAATLSAVSDLAFIRQTSAFNGMKTTQVLKRAVKSLDYRSTADKKVAIRSGLIADMWIDRTRSSNRFSEVEGSVAGVGLGAKMIGKYADAMAKASDITMRASLLAPWTEGARHAFGMEFMGLLADNAKLNFDDLPKPIARTFKRYGITTDDWEIMRNVNQFDLQGSKFIRPDDLADAKGMGITTAERNELVGKFMQMILTEMDYAVPTPDARVKTVTTMGTQRGSVPGEIMRSVSMLKSMPITVIGQQYYRTLQIEGLKDKGSYVTSLFIGTTVMGAAAYQLKEISKGREPLAMDNSKFWAAAVQQGGGLGIFGDFMFSDVNRYGQGIGSTLIGPMVPLVDDVAKLTLGNVHEFIGQEGNLEQKFEAMNLSGDIIRAAKNYTPGASLWYTRAAFERLVLEQAEMAADPQAKKKYIRLMKKRKSEYGQGYWWEPSVK